MISKRMWDGMKPERAEAVVHVKKSLGDDGDDEAHA